MAAALLAAVSMAALAQGPEARTLRIIVPAPPGGNLDAGARLIAQKLTVVSGEQWIVDNKPGAGTQIGTEYVVRSTADGRTLLYAGTFAALLPLLQKVNFSPMTDLVPVVQVSTDQYAMVASPSLPVAGVDELQKLAASRPDGLNCAAYPGASSIACEQLKARLGGRVTVVPFAGVAPALNSVLGGHADFMFVNTEPVLKLVQAGKLRVLAQTKGAGLQGPVITETWPGFFIEGHSGLLAPAGTPPERIQQLNREINKVLADPAVIAVMQEGGQEPVGGPPSRYGESLKRSYDRYGDVIRRLGLTPR